MSERAKPNEQYQPPNLQAIFAKVKAGDEWALADIQTYAEPIIRTKLQYMPNFDNELVVNTLNYILLKSPDFTVQFPSQFDAMNKGKYFETKFNAWCEVTARRKWFDRFRSDWYRTKAENRAVEMRLGDSFHTEHPSEEYPDLNAALHSLLPDVLESKNEIEIVALRLDGKSNEEIMRLAQEHHYPSVSAVAMQASRSIRKIDDKILTPAGFRRIASYAEQFHVSKAALNSAASVGALESIKLFGYFLYSSDNMVKAYLPHLRFLDPSLLEQGYIPISSVPEYNVLRSAEHRSWTVEHNNRIYIHQKRLAQFRKGRRRQTTFSAEQQVFP